MLKSLSTCLVNSLRIFPLATIVGGIILYNFGVLLIKLIHAIMKVNPEEAKKVIELCNTAPYFTLRHKNGEEYAYVRITAIVDNETLQADSWADKVLLDAIMKALNGIQINAEEYLAEEHVALEIKDLNYNTLENELLSGKKVIMLKDYLTPTGMSYVCAKSQYPNGEIHYCIKRTGILEALLEEYGLLK